LMSSVVASDEAIVAQIIRILGSDPSYKKYNGKRVFEFLYGDEDYELARDNFFREGSITGQM